MTSPRLGYFTRLLEDVDPAQRYRQATEQVVLAEKVGFDSAWIAQHHVNGEEGGLPSPLLFLTHLAAHTKNITLAPGVVVLPVENALRVAEDASVLSALIGDRLEIGFGTGGGHTTFQVFGLDVADKHAIYDEKLDLILQAWRGEPLGAREDGVQAVLYPPAPQLADTVWEATFSAEGAARIGARGSGLLLSRTQPRAENQPRDLPIWVVQEPLVEAYKAALPQGIEPRIAPSRTLFVADDPAEAKHWTEVGLGQVGENLAGGNTSLFSFDELVARTDTNFGTPEQVLERLSQDTIFPQATDILFQVHSITPPHKLILRSIELIAEQVAPELGWQPAGKK